MAKLKIYDGSSWIELAKKSDIPTNNNQLTNGAGYVTHDYYHTPSFSSGRKIATGSGVSDLYVPAASSSGLGLVYLGQTEQNTNQQFQSGTVAPQGHTHSQYLTSHQDISGKLDKSGGTMSGGITSTLASGYSGEFRATRGDYSIFFGIGSGNVNRGIYDTTNGSWLIYRDNTTNVYIGGAIYENGTALSSKYLGISAAAASAAKLNTNAGSATNPVYFSNGVPVACTYSLNKTVPSDAVFTDHQYSAGTGLSLSNGQFSVSTANVSTMINLLGEGTSAAQRDDYIVAQYAGGGTSTTSYHRRKLSNIFKALNASDITTALGYTPPTTNTTYSNATTSSAGLMSATDKSNLDGIIASLNNDDSDSVVNRLKDVLSVFSDYPEGTTVLSALNSKLNKSGGAMTGNISYQGSLSTNEMIKFKNNTSDSYGNGIAIGGGGIVIIGAGESSDLSYGSAGDETLYLAADSSIEFYSNAQNGLSSAKHMSFDTSGNLSVPNSISEGGTLLSNKYQAKGSYLTSHQSVSSSNNTASWGSTVVVGTVGGTELKFTMPSNPDTNTWRPVSGNGSSSDAARADHYHAISVEEYNAQTMGQLLATDVTTLDYNKTYVLQAGGKTTYVKTPLQPTAVTESTVSGWGFTKNAGTVKSVNGTSPDSNGNVSITIPTNNNQLTNGAGYITSSGSCSYANSAGSVAWANVSGKPSFATVATSGSYNDLSNRPTIPTNTNQLTNGAGFITLSDIPIASTSAWGICKVGSTEQYDPNGALTVTGTVAPQGHTHSNYLTSHQTMKYRPIKVNGTEKLSNTSSTALNLVAGNNVTLSESSGSVTINATDTNTWRPVKVNSTTIGVADLNLIAGSNVTLSVSGGDVTISASGGGGSTSVKTFRNDTVTGSGNYTNFPRTFVVPSSSPMVTANETRTFLNDQFASKDYVITLSAPKEQLTVSGYFICACKDEIGDGMAAFAAVDSYDLIPTSSYYASNRTIRVGDIFKVSDSEYPDRIVTQIYELEGFGGSSDIYYKLEAIGNKRRLFKHTVYLHSGNMSAYYMKIIFLSNVATPYSSSTAAKIKKFITDVFGSQNSSSATPLHCVGFIKNYSSYTSYWCTYFTKLSLYYNYSNGSTSFDLGWEDEFEISRSGSNYYNYTGAGYTNFTTISDTVEEI